MNRQLLVSVAGLSLAFVALIDTHRASGAVIYWNGTGTSWSSTADWSTNGSLTTPHPAAVPGSGDTATFNIAIVNSPQSVDLNANQAALGLVFSSTGSVLLEGGGSDRTLNLGTSGITDDPGAGAVTIGSATAGQQVAISLSGAQSWTNNSTVGVLTINGSTIDTEGYTLTVGGAGATTIGSSITGGGNLSIVGTGTVSISGANSTGSTSVNSGALQMLAGYLPGVLDSVGVSGNATFVRSGGTHSVSNTLTIGNGNSGTYNLVGNGLLTMPGANAVEYIGDTGTGSFTQSGGTHTISSGNLYIGYGDTGSYTLGPIGQLSVAYENIGYSGSGSFTQTGGTHSVSGLLYVGTGASGTYNLMGGLLSLPVAAVEYIGLSGSGSFNHSGGTNAVVNFALGYNTGSYGTYQLGGSGLLSAGVETVGAIGTGGFTQSGGTNTLSDTLYLGFSAGALGTYSLSGSGLLSASLETIGYYGTGVFTQSGGTNSVGGLVLAQNNGSVGTYALNGGLITLSALSQGAGSAAFNFSGGTLQAATTFAATAPFVLVSGGSGAIFFDTGGNTLTLAGGISGNGNLTKIGAGLLALSGASTYSGSTTVTAGTLAVMADNASSALVAESGAVLQFNGATVNLNTHYVRALLGGSVQYQNATINGGFLRGPGVHTLMAGSTNSFNATTINTGTVLQQNGSAAFIDVTNVGQLNNNAPLTWDGGLNNGGATLTIGNTAAVSEWNNAGLVVISSSGVLNNHATDLTSYGGGQITVNSGGTLNADSQSEGVALDLQDSLLVNNGTVTGTTNVNYGATVQGSGSFGLINVLDGGLLALSASASPVAVSLTVSSGSIVGGGQSAAPTTVADAAITTPGASDRLTLSGDISGAGPITKSGPGLLILSGSNSYAGGTTVTAGTLEVLGSSALADGSSLTVGSAATLLFNAAAGAPPAPPAAGIATVPEPGTVALLLAAIGAWCVRRGAPCLRRRPGRQHFSGSIAGN